MQHENRQIAGFEKLPSTAELIAWVRVLHASGVDPEQLKKSPYTAELLKQAVELCVGWMDKQRLLD